MTMRNVFALVVLVIAALLAGAQFGPSVLLGQ
jgi:hypothetical protein